MKCFEDMRSVVRTRSMMTFATSVRYRLVYVWLDSICVSVSRVSTAPRAGTFHRHQS